MPKRILKSIWAGWMRFVTVLGTAQMILLLTIVYWLLIPLVVIPFGIIGDPLRRRRSRGLRWIQREEAQQTIETASRQG